MNFIMALTPAMYIAVRRSLASKRLDTKSWRSRVQNIVYMCTTIIVESYSGRIRLSVLNGTMVEQGMSVVL